MGVGYDNIDRILQGDLAGQAVIVFCLLKFVSWCLSLGTGTSGGTLAPLFTIGGGLGSALGAAAVWALPSAGVDVRIAALVGMAALFAGASRALLASVVFAFETTRQPMGLLPLLGGCTAAYLVSAMLMRHSIMTEKIARRGARVVTRLRGRLPRSGARFGRRGCTGRRACARTTRSSACARGSRPHAEGSATRASRWWTTTIASSESSPDGISLDAGVTSGTVRERLQRPAAVVYDDSSLRDAADHMARENVGRLPVVARDEPDRVIGIVTRSDIIAAHASTPRGRAACASLTTGSGETVRRPAPRPPDLRRATGFRSGPFDVEVARTPCDAG